MNSPQPQTSVTPRSIEPTTHRIQTVVCLEEGTCCHRAVQHWISLLFAAPPDLFPVRSFPAGLRAATELPDSVLFLPHVHELCSRLTVSGSWTVLEDLVFPLQNPPLFLARRRHVSASGRKRFACATIPPLRDLIKETYGLSHRDFIDADSTQAAARLAARGERCSYCITNENGVCAYDLEPVQELKKMMIWWMPFQRAARGVDLAAL
jgi:hypothetical protein